MPEVEEKEQEIENLLEKIMKENFPNLVKEIGMQAQEAQRVPNKLDWTGPHQDTPKLISQDYTEGENLRSSKRKGHSYLQRSSHKAVNWFLKRDLAGKKGLERSIPSHKMQGPTSKIALSSKAII